MLEIINTILKNMFDGFIQWLGRAEERMWELENRSTEIFQSKMQREKNKF